MKKSLVHRLITLYNVTGMVVPTKTISGVASLWELYSKCLMNSRMYLQCNFICVLLSCSLAFAWINTIRVDCPITYHNMRQNPFPLCFYVTCYFHLQWNIALNAASCVYTAGLPIRTMKCDSLGSPYRESYTCVLLALCLKLSAILFSIMQKGFWFHKMFNFKVSITTYYALLTNFWMHFLFLFQIS